MRVTEQKAVLRLHAHDARIEILTLTYKKTITAILAVGEVVPRAVFSVLTIHCAHRKTLEELRILVFYLQQHLAISQIMAGPTSKILLRRELLIKITMLTVSKVRATKTMPAALTVKKKRRIRTAARDICKRKAVAIRAFPAPVAKFAAINAGTRQHVAACNYILAIETILGVDGAKDEVKIFAARDPVRVITVLCRAILE
jgi:hypothetical protein